MKKLIIPALLIIGIGFNVIAQKKSMDINSIMENNPNTGTVAAQQKSDKELKADKFYSIYAFDKAIDKYVHTKNLTTEGQRRLAESYHKRDMNIQSEIAYSKLINSNNGVIPDDFYNYAMVLNSNGKYDQSKIWMERFKDLKPNDLRAKNYAANNAELNNLLKDDGKYKISHLDLNTDAEDFGTCYYKNKIVFSSSRETPKLIERKYNWNNKPFLDMYVSEVDGDQLKKPENFSKILNFKWHDGPASFSNDGNFIAFTRNDYDGAGEDGIVKIQLYFSTFKDGQWTKPESFPFNNKNYSVGHPCLTSDGNTLYFASDMPGGYGGADIYRVTKDEKGNWSTPENLGDKINTEGDDMFPFFEENSEVLFFSSNGRMGLGGLDNFVCAVNGKEFGKVRNMGYPVNTQYDDFALIINDKFAKGYFSSNRVGGKGDDDIYSYELLKGLDIGKRLKGVAKDNSGNPIPQAFIQLLDNTGNVIDTLTASDKGAYSFLIDSDRNYKLIGKKPAYIEGETPVNSFGKEFVLFADITLDKIPETIAKKIEVGADLGKIISLKPIYFDFDKYDIRPDAEIELKQIVKYMNAYPNMVVELGSHTDCRGIKEYNQVLSDKRAKASAEYIKARITNPERIYGKGYGKSKLVNNCACDANLVSYCTEEQHQLNRRTEFVIIKK